MPEAELVAQVGRCWCTRRVGLQRMHTKFNTSRSGRKGFSSVDFGPSACAGGLSAAETLRVAWVGLLLRYPWDAFGTLTFAKNPGDEQVRRDFRTWLYKWMGDVAVSRGLARWVENPPHGPRLRGWWPNQRQAGKSDVVYVVGVESQQSGKLHLHTLLRFPSCFGEVSRRDGWALWFKCHGLARIVPPASQGDVAGYVSKYVVKPGADLVLSKSFQAVL